MRIGVDVRYLVPGRVGGSEVYVRGLLKAWSTDSGGHEIVLFTNRENAGSFDTAPWLSEAGDWRRRSEADVLFFPGTAMIPLRPGKKQVVTVHDLQHVRLPGNFSLRERFRRWRRERPSILHADAVIAVSSFTRDVVRAVYEIAEDKITAIPPGVDAALFLSTTDDDALAVRRKYGLPQEYLYYPARFWPHKNHARLFRAMQVLRGNMDFPHVLVLSGEPAAGPLPEGVRSLGYVPASDLPALYRAADALVFPSLYEGFGLPVLEAMAAGCPVVCSSAGALPEAAGSAAVFVDPENPDSIAAGLQRVLADSGLRSTLIAGGIARAKTFTWGKTAKRTLKVLEKVLDV